MLSETCKRCIERARAEDYDPVCLDILNTKVVNLFSQCMEMNIFYYGLIGEVKRVVKMQKLGFRTMAQIVSDAGRAEARQKRGITPMP